LGYEIDFLAVGEGSRSGDAIAVRFGNLYGERDEQRVIVIDGGFLDDGEALVEHIKKWYGTDRVDLVVSTHPDNDHTAGLKVVLRELQVDELWMHRPWAHARKVGESMWSEATELQVTAKSAATRLTKAIQDAEDLEEIANSLGVPIREPFLGVSALDDAVVVLGPTKEYYESLLPGFRKSMSELMLEERAISRFGEVVARVRESMGHETLKDNGQTSPENNSSAVIHIKTDSRRFLFTGDAGIPALSRVADVLEQAGVDPTTQWFFQAPHHGSRANVGPTVLDRLVGAAGVRDDESWRSFISAAPDGSPTHPSRRVTNALIRRGASVRVTRGESQCLKCDAPARDGWGPSEAEPFHDEVED
jgi:beta-lactamase superfamily II metal-dependent hydrolase